MYDSVQRYPAASATDTQSPLWMSVMPRIVPTGNSMLLILKPLKACSTFAWLGSGSRYRTSRRTPATNSTRMGVRRDQNSRRGRIRKQTSNIGLSKQTGRAKGRSFRQTAKARWQAAGCLGACESTPTPKVAATK